jgi:hypothetical protein
MNRIYGIILTLVLLTTASLPTHANSYKGTLERHGVKMEYSFSGGIVTNKSEPAIGGAPWAQMGVFIDGEVKAGSTVTASCRKLSGLQKFNEVNITILTKTNNGQTRQQDKKGNGSASISYNVPSDASEVKIYMKYRCLRTELCSQVTWSVSKQSNHNTQQSSSSSNSGYTTISSGTNFKDQLTRDGHTMRYSISGPTMKLKEPPYYPGSSGFRQIVKGYVKAGQTVSVDLAKVSGSGTPRVHIRFDYLKKGAVPRYSNAANMIHTEQTENISKSYTIPHDAEVVYAYIYYQIPRQGTDSDIEITANLYVGDRVPDYAMPSSSAASSSSSSPPPSTPTRNFKWNDIADDENCPKCKQAYSHYEVAKINGTAGQRCKDASGSYSKVTPLHPIYYNDNIQTKAGCEITLSHDEDEECLIIKENTSVLCEKLTNGTDRWYVYKGKIVGKNLVRSNRKPTFQMSNCTAYPKGTVFVLEDDGQSSRVYLLSGAMEVTSKKTKKKQTLQPGQMSDVGTNGQLNVQTFDVSAVARRYGISTSGMSTTTSTPTATGNNGLVFTADKLNYKILSDKTVEVTGELRGTYKGKVKIPSQVKHQGKTYQVVGIGRQAFANQSQLTGIDIPTSVKNIAEDAFLNSGLTQVTIPGDKVKIIQNAFHNCRKLTTATVSGRDPNCSPQAFTGCSSMKELRIRDIKPQNYGKKLPGTNAIIKQL